MIRIVTCAGALLLAACSPVCANWSSTIAASNPLNWYRLDEISGSIAYDYGSEGLNATYGAPGYQSPSLGVPGLVGTAVEFKNGAEIIVLNGANLTGNWSAEFILKKTAQKDSQALLTDLNGFEAFALKLEQWWNTHQLGYTEYGVGDYLFSPSATAPLGQFIDLVYVKKADGVQLYINGILKGSNSTPISLPRYSVSNGLDPLFAILDEIIIYDRALSPDEIVSHFASIPEPSTILLTIAALATLLARRRKTAS